MKNSVKLSRNTIYKILTKDDYHYVRWDGIAFYNKEGTIFKRDVHQIVCLGVSEEKFKEKLRKRNLI